MYIYKVHWHLLFGLKLNQISEEKIEVFWTMAPLPSANTIILLDHLYLQPEP